jgi:hypothetical protein
MARTGLIIKQASTTLLAIATLIFLKMLLFDFSFNLLFDELSRLYH